MTVTIDEGFGPPLRERAEKNGRSVSGEVEWILRKAGIQPVAHSSSKKKRKEEEEQVEASGTH